VTQHILGGEVVVNVKRILVLLAADRKVDPCRGQLGQRCVVVNLLHPARVEAVCDTAVECLK
jgi:hypothetical protein